MVTDCDPASYDHRANPLPGDGETCQVIDIRRVPCLELTLNCIRK